MIVRCQQQAAACREVYDLIGLAARRSSYARRRYPVTCGCTVRKHGRRYLIEVKRLRVRLDGMAARTTGFAAALQPAMMVQAVAVPTNLCGYIALRRENTNRPLGLHDRRPMPAASPRVRYPQQRREANAKGHHSDDQFPRGHTGFPVEFLSANAVVQREFRLRRRGSHPSCRLPDVPGCGNETSSHPDCPRPARSRHVRAVPTAPYPAIPYDGSVPRSGLTP
jgi:hypothetical protein